MRFTDALLIAPLGFCVAAAVLGLLVDISFAQLCLSAAAASGAALGLHWLLGRLGRRARSRQ